MAIICPTILASTKDEFDEQVKRVSFAPRLQLDFMDGEFAPTKSIDLEDASWPEALKADLHLMYRRPMDYLETILRLKPNLVIVHAEADVGLDDFAEKMRNNGIKAGLCVLPETSVDDVAKYINEFDHLLIFGGKLGYFGGEADLSQATKAKEAKQLNPSIETGWDGGVNAENAKQLVESGIDVLNVGGFIQKAENPETAYKTLVKIVS